MVEGVMEPTGDHVRSTIQFGVKLVVYFCVHKHFRQQRAMERSFTGNRRSANWAVSQPSWIRPSKDVFYLWFC